MTATSTPTEDALDITGHSEAPPAPVVAIQLAGGFIASQAVYAFTKLRLSDALSDGPLPVGKAAAVAGTNTDFTYRLLRTLGSLGVVDESSPGTFRLTEVGELFRNEPGSLADLTMMWMETHYAWFSGLADTVTDGQPAFERIEGRTFWDWLGRNDDENELFSRAMTSIGAQTGHAAVAAYDFGTFDTIVDVAGAHGSFLSAALGSNESARGVLFDLPHVVESAGPALEELGLSDRVDVVGGDFFESVPAGGDAYLLRFILHDWNDDQSIQILSSIRRSIPDDGVLLIVENVIPEGNEPHLGKLLDLIMMTILPGVERTSGEFADLLSQAGFRLDEIVPTEAPTSVIVARPA